MSDMLDILNVELSYWIGRLDQLDASPIKNTVERTKAQGAIEALGRILDSLKGKRA